MLAALLQFEWRYQIRRPAFAAVVALFAAIGFTLAATEFGPADIRINSPWSTAHSIGVATLLAVLAASFFCAQATLRDAEHRMTELVFSTALTKSRYLIVRFGGAAAALAAAFAFTVPGLLAGTYLAAHDPARIGPLDTLNYLQPFLLLALPNLLFVTALLFAVALVTRSAIATYVGGVLIYVGYFAVALFSGSPLMAGTSPPTERAAKIAALVDPFGLSAFYATTRYWTAAEREIQRPGFDGALALNRALWVVLAATLFAVVYRRFALRVTKEVGARRQAGTIAVTRRPDEAGTLSSVRPRAGALASWQAFASAARLEIRHVLRGWPFVALAVGWAASFAVEILQTFGHGEFGIATVPTTALLLREMDQPLALVGVLAVVYYAAEVVWRERLAQMAEIVDATPAPSGALYAAKLAALAALTLALGLVTVAVALVLQFAAGAPMADLALYPTLLLFAGAPLALVIVLVVAIQTLVPNRYVGILASALVLLFWHRGQFGGPEHPLVRYAGVPEVPYSDLAGFGPELVSFAWFAAYWAAFAWLVALGTRAIWRRGTETSLAGRVRAGIARATRGRSRDGETPGSWILPACVAVAWITLGGFVFHQTNRLNVYRTEEAVETFRADYERRYRYLEQLPQPVPVEVSLAADLHPEDRRASLRGTYRLENRTFEPITELWITARRDLASLDLRVRGRGPSATDAAFGTYRFSLEAPLAPGESTELEFDLEVRRRGAVAGATDHDLLANGTFLLANVALPTVGYRRGYEIEEPWVRERLGLPPSRRSLTLESAAAGELTTGSPVPIDFEAIVTTAGDQIAIAPGTLVESGSRDGRRFFRYRSEGPISPMIALASGRFTTAEVTVEGVRVEVLHHPSHGRNVAAILEAARRSLAYCIREFGPYPHRDLRIVELPWFSTLADRGRGFAVPGVVFLLENAGFLTDRTDGERVDVVTKRVAHEVAHQWWGHQVAPGPLPGASSIVETLARYTELRVVAGLHGEAAVPPVLSYELDRYLRGRADGQDAPLARVEDQAYIYYSKGALAMSAIRERIGEAAVNRALHRLVDEARGGSQPDAARLVSALLAESPERDRAFVEESWNGVALYDLRVEEASATAIADGVSRVEVRVSAKREDARTAPPLPLAIDEAIEIALYADDPGYGGRGTPIHSARYRLRGDDRIAIDVAGTPRFVLVDPRIERIDRQRADNLKAIERR